MEQRELGVGDGSRRDPDGLSGEPLAARLRQAGGGCLQGQCCHQSECEDRAFHGVDQPTRASLPAIVACSRARSAWDTHARLLSGSATPHRSAPAWDRAHLRYRRSGLFPHACDSPRDGRPRSRPGPRRARLRGHRTRPLRRGNRSRPSLERGQPSRFCAGWPEHRSQGLCSNNLGERRRLLATKPATDPRSNRRAAARCGCPAWRSLRSASPGGSSALRRSAGGRAA